MNNHRNSHFLSRNVLGVAAILAASMIACVPQAQSAPKVPEPPPIVHCFTSTASGSQSSSDSFARVGDVVANGTRWAWSELGHAWVIVNSEDTKRRVTDAYHSAREYVSNSLKESSSVAAPDK